MAGGNKCGVGIGIDNILRYGLFHLNETEWMKRNFVQFYSTNDHDLWIRIPEQPSSSFRHAILCLGTDDFIPTWLSPFFFSPKNSHG